jgi:hypothetical protein
METTQKKRGRPPVRDVAMTPAQRKQQQRVRQAQNVMSDNHEMTDAECLAILVGKRWRGGAIDKGAWQRLGQLRGFVTVT